MKTEDGKINITLKKFVPELSERMESLYELRNSWPFIVGLDSARNSVPYDFKDDTIFIAAKNQHTAQKINNMKGNIRRIFFAKYSLKPDIKITLGPPPAYEERKNLQINKNKNKTMKIQISDEEVNEFLKDMPPELPHDAAYALAHLRVFFNKRFPVKD